MSNTQFSRGSEWRKWDLHVHTPCSELNNGFGDDWDSYVKNLFKKAMEHNVAAIGITDYFTIEGYKKLKNDYLGNAKKLGELFSEDEIGKIRKILILPNIEFRLDKLVDDSRVNFHVIFSDEVSIQDIEENFLHDLEFIYEGEPQNTEERWKLKVNNLVKLGEKLQEQHDKFKGQSELFTGMMNAVVSDTKICKLLENKKSLFAGKYLIALPADEDLSQLGWDGQSHQTRKVLVQKSDCFFTSNEKSIKWGLGELGYDDPGDYVAEFKSLKPCIWGSDAHKSDELFTKNAQRLLWIKGDPTFRGLFQIKHEPYERVRIQATNPEEKKPYQIIDHVRFMDARAASQFGAKGIPLNQNLSVIIGGKSTGKSLLLYHIARSIDPAQVDEKLSQLIGVGYDLEEDADFDFEVKWKDGGLSKLKGGSESDEVRKITYIPQHYLSSLSKRENLDDRKNLNNFVRDALLADEDSKIEEVKNRQTAQEKQKEISALINDFFGHVDNFRTTQKEVREIGNKDGITKYLKQLKAELAELKKRSDLNDSEQKKVVKLTEKGESIKKEIANLKEDSAQIESFSKKAKILSKSLSELKVDCSSFLNLEASRSDFDGVFKFIDRITAQIDTASESLIGEDLFGDGIDFVDGSLSKRRDENSVKLQDVVNELKPLLSRMVQEEAIKKKTKIISGEEEKIRTIELKEKALAEMKQKMKAIFGNIFKCYQEIYDSYQMYKAALNRSKDSLGDVMVSVRVAFDSDRFSQTVKDRIQKVDLRNEFSECRREDGGFYLKFSDIERFQDILQNLCKGVINNSLRLYKNANAQEVISSLLKDFFHLDFSVSYKNDQIEKMSPGKRNLVLLKIIVEMNNQEWPILIDQPEDDLDNRSVYHDLVTFLKDKKKERQIIVVTHNPNVAIGADAEQVIVSNQSGQDSSRDNEKYDFEYISGSIENSSVKDGEVTAILPSMGIREHVCDILEGGEDAFKKREQKYFMK